MIFHPINKETLQAFGTPESMNNPLCYEPHPLCIAVCKEMQTYLAQRSDWREEIDRGKMFGILIVENRENAQIGYLAAYSGQLGGRGDWDDFVPTVFDYLQPDSYFKTHEAEISHINHSIRQLEQDERMANAKHLILALQAQRQKALDAFQQKMKEAKDKRDARREEARQNGTPLCAEEEAAMTKESQFLKAELRRLKKSLAEKTTLETEYADYQDNIIRLKQLRKQLSDSLQQWLFSQFRMLNWQGEEKDLQEIFRDAALMENPQTSIASKRMALKMVPPAGSGECCEPKLLQYAFLHGYKPLQMAMFWWGKSPKAEIRHHLSFYPACQGKCKPILQWMLPEALFSTNTIEADSTIYKKVETIFEDRELAVIHKPEGLLSVPGKDASQPSVYSLMRKRYPDADSPLIVHRLDMATSGLMVIAKTDFAYHRLQKQFLYHRVQKKYVAIIGCKSKEECDKIPQKSTISLPLMPDYLDRPRQTVNHELGKKAVTEYEVLERIDDTHLRLALYPKTGRTHQLRVHCAHWEGLDAPILGDPLYSNEKASRLHLHAEEITFDHPLTRERITLTRKADF